MGTHSFLKIILGGVTYSIYYQYDGDKLYGIVVRDLIVLKSEFSGYSNLVEYFRSLPIMDFSDQEMRDDGRVMGLGYIKELGYIPNFNIDESEQYNVEVNFDNNLLFLLDADDILSRIKISTIDHNDLEEANSDIGLCLDEWNDITDSIEASGDDPGFLFPVYNDLIEEAEKRKLKLK